LPRRPQSVLVNDVAEFLPYVFQLLAVSREQGARAVRPRALLRGETMDACRFIDPALLSTLPSFPFTRPTAAAAATHSVR
jgi:hypothetical protein